MAPPGYRRFRYTGRDAAGQPVSGEITAASEAHALSQLREGGMFVSSVQDRGSAGSSKGEDSVLQVIFSGAPLKARSFFFRQLSMLIRSGISAGEALRVLASQTTNHVLQDIAAQGAQQCTAGGKMSDAFRRHPRVFSSVVIEMVTAGEEAGHLEQFLDRIADYLEREYQIASKIRTALAYPMVVFLALIFVPNVPTLVLKGFRPYAAATFPWFLEIMAVAVGAWLLSRVLLAVPSIALAFDHIKLSLPIIGKVTRQFAIGKFGRTLAMMYGAGISLSRALRVASASCGNRYMAQELAKTVPVVESGGRLTDAIRATGCFPVMTTHIMDTGERTGNVDEMVTKLAEFAEQDANAAVDQGIALILPVAIIILAILVVPSLIKSYTSYATNEVTAADH